MNKSVAIITDLHLGVRNDNLDVLSFQKKFYDEIFFPTLEERDIKIVICCGDLFDKRKYTNHLVVGLWQKFFFDELAKKNIEFVVIVGNHDIFFQESNSVNAPNLFLKRYHNVSVYSEPTEVQIYGNKILLIPWINKENSQKTYDLIEKTDATIALGHLQIKDFEMYKNNFIMEGIDESLFSKFSMVGSGHFHHKSTRSNIHYFGSPYQMTWSDFEDDRGFHILDFSNQELEFIKNPNELFKKIIYDDKKFTLDEMLKRDLAEYKNCYVKLIVSNKSNPANYDIFVDKLDNAGCIDIEIIDDHLNLNTASDEEIFSGVQDIQDILSNYVNQIDFDKKEKLNLFMKQLYDEALISQGK